MCVCVWIDLNPAIHRNSKEKRWNEKQKVKSWVEKEKESKISNWNGQKIKEFRQKSKIFLIIFLMKSHCLCVSLNLNKEEGKLIIFFIQFIHLNISSFFVEWIFHFGFFILLVCELLILCMCACVRFFYSLRIIMVLACLLYRLQEWKYLLDSIFLFVYCLWMPRCSQSKRFHDQFMRCTNKFPLCVWFCCCSCLVLIRFSKKIHRFLF